MALSIYKPQVLWNENENNQDIYLCQGKKRHEKARSIFWRLTGLRRKANACVLDKKQEISLIYKYNGQKGRQLFSCKPP